MGLLLDRSGDAAFGNHQTLRRAKLKQASMTIRRTQRGITVSLRFTPTLRLKLPKESSAYSLLLLPCSRAPTDVFDQRESRWWLWRYLQIRASSGVFAGEQGAF